MRGWSQTAWLSVASSGSAPAVLRTHADTWPEPANEAGLTPQALSPEQAVLGLFRTHADGLFRFCRAALRRHEDAEDVVQETFLKLLRHLQSGGDTANLRAWLFAVAANACRDRQRSWRRWRPFDTQQATAAAPADTQLEVERREDAVARAFARLGARDRLLLALRAEGLSYRELARAARTKPTSVGTLLARALRRWQRAYAVVGGSGPCGTV